MKLLDGIFVYYRCVCVCTIKIEIEECVRDTRIDGQMRKRDLILLREVCMYVCEASEKIIKY